MPPRVLCIWFPDWSVQRLVVARPELRDRMIVLHACDARRRQQVVACCPQANQRGIRIGMPLAEAAALSSPEEAENERGTGHFFPHDPAQDRKALRQLADWCERFSPIVGWEEGPAHQSLLLDVTGLAGLFGGESALAEQVVGQLGQLGYRPRVAVADTIGAAWAIAHFHAGRTAPAAEPPTLPVVGRPDGLSTADPQAWFVVRPGEGGPALGPLPVACLRLPEETIQVLAQLGVQCVEQLMKLPRAGLAARLGGALIDRLDQALGAKAEVIVAQRPRPDFAVDWPLETPTDRRQELAAILAGLSARLGELLAAHDQGAIQVEGVLASGADGPTVIRVGLFQPTADGEHLRGLLCMQLETVKLRHPVSHVRLCAVTTVRMASQQHELWNDAAPGGARELASLIDRLSSRLGDRHVLRMQPGASALPELAYDARPLTAAGPGRRQRQAIAKPSVGSPLERPLWLQNPPLPLTLASGATDGPPLFFCYQNQGHEVARHWGPERIETAWWHGPCVRRDYYRVETTDGSRFWLFRRLNDDQWFLHGYFE